MRNLVQANENPYFRMMHASVFFRAFWTAACLVVIIACAPLALMGQKGNLKGKPVVADSAKAGGKGGLKGTPLNPQDTLHANKFVPRTVIDSFPSMPPGSVPENLKTSVTRKDLEDSMARMLELKALITRGDSLVAIRRMDPLPEWPADRVNELAQALEQSKKILLETEKRHASLLKRFDSAYTPVATSPPARHIMSANAAPAPPTKPAPSNSPGGSAGKANLKGGK
jgi:hypothetical protein